jgi:hypothetical protein
MTTCLRHRGRFGDGVTGKCGPASEHLVEDQPKRPDVRALVDRLAPRLLRRHVGGRAENHAALVSAAGLMNVSEFGASAPVAPDAPAGLLAGGDPVEQH